MPTSASSRSCTRESQAHISGEVFHFTVGGEGKGPAVKALHIPCIGVLALSFYKVIRGVPVFRVVGLLSGQGSSCGTPSSASLGGSSPYVALSRRAFLGVVPKILTDEAVTSGTVGFLLHVPFPLGLGYAQHHATLLGVMRVDLVDGT